MNATAERASLAGIVRAYNERSDFESIAITRQANLAYQVAADPEYWAVFCRWTPPEVPQLTQGGLGFGPPGPAKDWLIDVTFDSLIEFADPSVDQTGFLGAQLLYGWAGLWTQQAPAPHDLGNSLPTMFDAVNSAASMAAVWYDPVPLPISGANFPIWTQGATDPLTVRTYLQDFNNPGALFGVSFLQINGSVEVPTAVQIVQRMRWKIADEQAGDT